MWNCRESSISTSTDIFTSTDKNVRFKKRTEHYTIILWSFEIFLSLKSFGNSLIYTSSLLIIMLCLTCGERKSFSTIKKSPKYYEHDCRFQNSHDWKLIPTHFINKHLGKALFFIQILVSKLLYCIIFRLFPEAFFNHGQETFLTHLVL